MFKGHYFIVRLNADSVMLYICGCKQNFYFIDGALYYLKGPGKATKTKVVRGTEEANGIFRDFHDSPTGAHTGQKRTRDAISKRFFWTGMSADIDKWVSKHCN